MKLTIIRADGSVYRNGTSFHNLNLSFIPENIHALQWDTDRGWIEFSEDTEGNRQPNVKIDVLPEWATMAIESWNAANSFVFSANTANT